MLFEFRLDQAPLRPPLPRGASPMLYESFVSISPGETACCLGGRVTDAVREFRLDQAIVRPPLGRKWLVGHPPGRCGEFGSHWWFGRFDLVSRFVLGPGRRCGPAARRGRVDAKVLWSGLHSAGTLYRGPFSLRAASASPMRIERRVEPDARLAPVRPACGRGRAGPRCCSSFVSIRPCCARPCPGGWVTDAVREFCLD